MKLINVISCACITATCATANAGLVFGQAAHDQFQALQIQHNEGFNDFESFAAQTNLLPGTDPFGDGTHFASVINTSGFPFGPEHVEVSNAYAPATYGNSLVGSPFQFGSDDARVGYEITFDTSQRRAGLLRLWNTSSLTSFYNAAGDLLATHQNTANQEFVGYMADSSDSSTWVARILMDGALLSNARQVGHSDDLYFGRVVPAPCAVTLLALTGLAATRRRR